MSFRPPAIAVFSCAVVAALIALSSPAQTHDYVVVDGAISASLTGQAGDPANGKKAAVNRKKGNCLACHSLPIPEEQFHGEVGPNLAGVASRYSAGEIRVRIVDPKLMNADTIMPAFHKTEGLHRQIEKFKGKTILSAQEVEDIVAYLMTLTE